MPDLAPLARRLLAAEKILVATHSAPDGDGLGCQLALLHVLESLERRVTLVGPGAVAPRFSFLPGSERVLDWSTLSARRRTHLIRSVDIALVVDTHEWVMLGALGEALRSAAKPTLFLDHHPISRPEDPDLFCDPQASSAGEVCWALIRTLHAPITPAVATCLYAAIAYDTNMFRYLRGRAETHRVAAELMSLGANTERIYRHVFASESVGKMALLGEVLRSFHLEFDGRVSWTAVGLDLIERTGATPDELRNLIVPLLEIDRVEIALLFKERTDGQYKVSLRSKGRFPVDGVAGQLGGGGHSYAAGAHVAGPLEHARDRVLSLIAGLFAEPPDR